MLTKEYVQSLSYTDFVAFVNQTNVPPGSYATLREWRVFSDLDQRSNVFEAACTTGFSILNLCKDAGCTGMGVDISCSSVKRAKENASLMGLSEQVTFVHSDATSNAITSDRFSHVVVGAALRFFPDPQVMLNRVFELLGSEGYILASPFYTTDEIPQHMITRAQKVFGITPTTESYKDVMRLYKGLDIVYENRKIPLKETHEELEHYCSSTVDRICADSEISDSAVKNELFRRLYEVKEMSNDLREYQGYSTLVLKYDRTVHPHRYTELF